MSTAEASGVIYVPAGISTDFITVDLWAADQECFERIVAEFAADVREGTPFRNLNDTYSITAVARWQDGNVHYCLHGPKRQVELVAQPVAEHAADRLAAQDDPRGERDR